jgi:hypothetical protein
MRIEPKKLVASSRWALAKRSRFVFALLATSSTLGLSSCEKDPVPTIVTERAPTAPPAGMTLTMASIDGVPPDDMLGVGKDVLVELTSSRNDAVVCVLVHPLMTDTWWVQNLPSLPNKGADGVWHWRTTAFCGTETLGRREKYEILGVAEADQSICVVGRQMKVAEANRQLVSLVRSPSVTVKRVRD